MAEHVRPPRLRVQEAALDFVALADRIADRLPPGRAELADQLRRAATSIHLNVAEGAGEFSPKEKARFYRMARRSAAECDGALSLILRLRLAPEEPLAAASDRLQHILAMLTRLCINLDSRT